mmetsp:Transcript_20676/g.30391  ORF Transcript_20676/g.30391 Transcript_20676/m.30391 type:complete len:232 (+) Transcript_20676:102-797(+)
MSYHDAAVYNTPLVREGEARAPTSGRSCTLYARATFMRVAEVPTTMPTSASSKARRSVTESPTYTEVPGDCSRSARMISSLSIEVDGGPESAPVDNPFLKMRSGECRWLLLSPSSFSTVPEGDSLERCEARVERMRSLDQFTDRTWSSQCLSTAVQSVTMLPACSSTLWPTSRSARAKPLRNPPSTTGFNDSMSNPAISSQNFRSAAPSNAPPAAAGHASSAALIFAVYLL